MGEIKEDRGRVKKFHDYWAFLILIILYLSFYSYLALLRFTRISDADKVSHSNIKMYSCIFLFTLASVVVIYTLIITIEHTSKLTYYMFIPVSVLFLIYNSSLYEKICCLIAILKFLYFICKYREFNFSSTILYKSMSILKQNFVSCIIFCISCNFFLVLHSKLYIGIYFKNQIEMYLLNLVFIISLYCLSSFLVYATKIFIYNLFMHSCTENVNTSFVSLRNTIYSLGSVSLSFCSSKTEDSLRPTYVIYYLAKYVISCLSYTYEIVIHITTSYLLYIIGIHNFKLKVAHREKHKLEIKSSLKRQIEYLNDYLVILGCLYMLGINKMYIVFTKNLNLGFFDMNCLVYTYNISFVFSISMLLISSSFISLIFLYTDNPSLLMTHDRRLFNFFENMQ